jgi:mannose-6-phosphate isomerase
MIEPLILNPPIKDYIWGGTKLREQFGKESSLERLAESWELACHRDGSSIIANGEYAGKSLTEYLEENSGASGTNCKRFEYFPVLIKLIDACDDLSVQVHPDNEYAMRVEGEYGKTEMWYVIDCEPDAQLIYGFKEKISKEDFCRAIEENTLLDIVNVVPVKKGDVFFINSGTLHAIGKGILIAEIQQNSNTTYRVYDYGRKGADGMPRELHIDKAVDVTELSPSCGYKEYKAVEKNGNIEKILADCDYFTALKTDINESPYEINVDSGSFRHILSIDGEGVLSYGEGSIPFKKGTSVFLPAGMGECTVKGKCSIIITEIN